MESNSTRVLVWDEATFAWGCWHCGCTEFTQTVIAENYVAPVSGDILTLIESDDFVGSWEVISRNVILCDNCHKEVTIPNNVEVLEQCAWSKRT